MAFSDPQELDQTTQRMKELAGKASIGAAWTFFGFGGRQIIRLISNLILTRLLIKDDFGLMVIVNVFVLGLELFSDVGIGPAVIQNKRDDDSFVNTVWTIQVIRGFSLFTIAFMLAPFYAEFMMQQTELLFGEAMLARRELLKNLVRLASTVALVDGFLSTNFFTQNRNLAIKRLIVLEILAQIVGVTVMITWALNEPSVWALVAGGIATAFTSTILSHVWLSGIKNRFHYEKKAAKALFSFGVWIFLSTMAMYFADYGDRVIIGKITTLGVLGVYSITLMLAAAPSQALSHVASNIIFPFYSRVAQEGEDLPKAYKNVRFPLLVIGGWMTAGLIAGGPTIVRVLYTEPYWEGGWMLQIVASGMWFGTVLQGTNGAAVLAIGKSNWTFASSVAKLIGIGAFIYPGFQTYGFVGALGGLALSEVLRYIVSAIAAAKHGMWGLRQDAVLSVVVALAAALAWVAIQAVPTFHPAAHAAIVFVVVSLVWAPLLWPLVRRVLDREPLFNMA